MRTSPLTTTRAGCRSNPTVRAPQAIRARGIERLALDGVAERDASVVTGRKGLDEGIGSVPEREHRLVDTVAREPIEDPGDHRPIKDGEHLLRHVVGKGPKPGSLAADEQEGAHLAPCRRCDHVDEVVRAVVGVVDAGLRLPSSS